jgi:hypothetical protein
LYRRHGFLKLLKMLADNPTVDVGIHLAITSEWDNVKWRPLTDCASLRDAEGYFYPMIKCEQKLSRPRNQGK